MLTGGFAPCLPLLPIKKIKLQGRYDGYETDDCIVFLEERTGGEGPKLLAQIKHTLSITEGDDVFAEVIAAAWRDFKNPKIFDARCDALALITGPLSATDIENARVILEWARTSATTEEFFTKVDKVQFSSDAKRAKLQAFRSQLRKANANSDVSDTDLWQFLKCYHLLGYDLDVASGVTLSLLNSHIGQFATGNVAELFGAVSKEVASFGQNAGTMTIDTLSEQVRNAFRQRVQTEKIPSKLIQPEESQGSGIPTELQNAVAFASLLGSWDENVDGDCAVVKELIEGND